MTEMDQMATNGYSEVNGTSNGGDHHHKSSRPRESSEERRIRKEKERAARENETEEERRIRKDKERREREERHKNETEEERRARKERERKEGRDSGKDKKKETEEERAARKERERKERDGRKNETEEERRIRKEKERKEKEGRHNETEEERAARKEKERRERKNETEEERAARKEKEKRERDDRRKNETEEERAARKEKERKERKHETEEERRIRKEKERKEKGKETEEERAARKERERQERKDKEHRSPKKEVKDEPMELGDDYFAQEDAKLDARRKVKQEEQSAEMEDEEDGGGGGGGSQQEFDDREEEEYKPDIKEESDEDVPLAARKADKKRKMQDDDSDDEPLSKKKAKNKKQQRKKSMDYEEEEEDFKPAKKKPKVEKKEPPQTASPNKKMTKKEKEKEEEKKVWKWWEEQEQLPDGVKWRFLEHKGPMLAPDYEPLPSHVKFWYDGKVMKLSQDTEEAATFYGRMLDHDYTTKEVFNKNFFKDWRKLMTEKEKEIIRDLQKCDFSQINEHFKKVSEERKNRSKEEKKAEKERNEAIVQEYGFCQIDGHKERIGNFRIEPPGLFRGRGEHPKQGMIKRRTMPEDVIINCSKDSEFPKPPPGHKWKKVQHDNAVTWLASWTENIQGQIKYVMLNPSSKLKGEKDWQKYEKARKLKEKIDNIRQDYMEDMKSKEMRVRQRAVALYFIDKLALRAGNEKDEDQADTVGCCSLRFEHIELHDQLDGKEHVVEFDFLGKDSIRYQNAVAVEKRVFKNLKLFMEDKKEGDDLFDRLNTAILNQYLNSLMDGLTAKVFRTYNASFTLQQQLNELTNDEDPIQAKLLSYNRANRAVAVLCNHQRAVPKTHEKSMENLNVKIEAKQDAIKEAQKQVKAAKKASKNGQDKAVYEKKKKMLERMLEQLEKLEIQKTDKDENKTIALGTSKLNYLDPRISVAWCKKHEVPIEKVYNKTQREKFRWAIDMADEDYEF
eukprot:TRINITY_DN3788_c0_g1_i5.p1 TRINITY_DN3788_c0_g1~~TRINITY_DN3788_c0_g1_i5.p1  ORF type:complete len:970 (-),score=493.65 TRINITY_DN3788_c0_g1_i5:651-3560(-)